MSRPSVAAMMNTVPGYRLPEGDEGAPPRLQWAADGVVVVVGAGGGIGGALCAHLAGLLPDAPLVRMGRHEAVALDLLDDASIHAARETLAAQLRETGRPLRLFIDATGFLHGPGARPEKTWRELDRANLMQQFAVNAVGPALLMQHFLPLLPRQGRAVWATLSAKVGSIGDNRLGGWYGYRAAKAALNQFVCTAAIELRRQAPQAACVALHPGTVDTGLSAPFARAGLSVQAPAEAAARLCRVIDGLTDADSGGFFDHSGARLPW